MHQLARARVCAAVERERESEEEMEFVGISLWRPPLLFHSTLLPPQYVVRTHTLSTILAAVTSYTTIRITGGNG